MIKYNEEWRDPDSGKPARRIYVTYVLFIN